MKRFDVPNPAASQEYLVKRRRSINRIVWSARTSAVINTAIALGKVGLGIYALSPFLCVNGLYNIGVGVAKTTAVKGYQKPDPSDESRRDVNEEYRRYHRIGIVLALTSVVYLIYCISMLTGGNSHIQYGTVLAITIAAVTFTEIGLAVRGIVTTRRNREPVMEAISLTNLATSLISLVLTQTALMSLSQNEDIAFACGLTGVIFGSLSVGIGLYMMIRMRKLRMRGFYNEKESQNDILGHSRRVDTGRRGLRYCLSHRRGGENRKRRDIHI